MVKWFVSSAVTIACAAAIGIDPAAGAPGGTFGCQKTIQGHTWSMTGHGLTCDGAAAILAKLSKVTVPATGKFVGRYSGMQCGSTTIGRKPTFVGCADGKGKNIYAVRKT